MAPPRHRNRGFSRRIQYGLFFGYVAAAVGLVAGLGLLLVARYDPVAFQGIRGLALDLTTPFSALTRPIARGAGAVGDQAGAYLDAARQNVALRDELAATRRQLVAARATALENKRLRRMLRLVDPASAPIVAARIVGSDPTGVRRYATLAAGSADGVAAGQPVRGPEGLIGRVAEAGAHAARVLLLTDGASSVPVQIARTGQPVLAQGRGETLLELHATTLGPAPFARGDLLVTSGVGGVYPPGIPVAVVTSAAGEIAAARPLADPARLDYAMILRPVATPPPPAAPVGVR